MTHVHCEKSPRWNINYINQPIWLLLCSGNNESQSTHDVLNPLLSKETNIYNSVPSPKPEALLTHYLHRLTRSVEWLVPLLLEDTNVFRSVVTKGYQGIFLGSAFAGLFTLLLLQQTNAYVLVRPLYHGKPNLQMMKKSKAYRIGSPHGGCK